MTILPGEVVRIIVSCLTQPEVDDDMDLSGLTQCSLTCRVWAHIIRPVLFEHLWLRLPEDVNQLFKLLECASPIVPEMRGFTPALIRRTACAACVCKSAVRLIGQRRRGSDSGR